MDTLKPYLRPHDRLRMARIRMVSHVGDCRQCQGEGDCDEGRRLLTDFAKLDRLARPIPVGG